MKTCASDDCTRPHRARGLCSTHYNQTLQPHRHRTIEVACAWCGTAVAKQATARYSRRFCSLLCRDVWRIESMPGGDPLANARPYRQPLPPKPKALPTCCPVTWLACVRCGAAFPRVPRGRRVYCSVTCARRAASAARAARRHGRRRIRRTDIFERDGYVCWLCDQPCDRAMAVPHPLAPTVDHLVPRVHGGDDELDNLATAHFRCNSVRGASWDVPATPVGHAA